MLNTVSRHAEARGALANKLTVPQMMSPMADAPANALEVPFKHSLGKNDAETGLYTVIDADGDGRTWNPALSAAYVCMAPKEDNITANDDWLVSPPIHLVEGKEYAFSIDISSVLSSGTEEQVGVYLGTGNEASDLKTVLIPVTKVTSKNSYTTLEQTFSVPAEGYYYIGIHCVSVKDVSKNTRAKDFTLAEAKAAVDPPAAGTLSYQLAPKGELKATVTYTAPSVTESGAPLEAISKVEIKTNWLVSHTFTDVTPGETITFETELYNNAYNRIEATAYVDDTPGETVMIKDFFAGPDNPLPVENLKISLSDDYKHVTLSWDPVSETGERGGYVDTSKAVYYIFDAFGSYYDPALAQTSETSYTFDYSDFEGQDFVAFQVTSGIDEIYYSLESTSDIVCVGQPDALPWHESFSNAYYSQLWAIDPESSYYGVMCGTVYDNELQTNMEDEDAEPEYLNSQDDDNGFFFFLPTEKDAMYGFFSTKISLAGTASPVFEFYYQGKGSEIDAMVAENGGEFKAVKTIDLKADPTDGWTLCRVPLDAYKNSPYVQIEIRLRAVHNTDETTWSLPLDNIRIRDLVETDLRLVGVSVPAVVKAGDAVEVTANVENLGTKIMKGALATLSVDGKDVEQKTLGDIEPDAFSAVTFNYSTNAATPEQIMAEVTLSYEGNPGLHPASASATVKINHSDYPSVDNLTAQLSGNNDVVLEWTLPSFDGMLDAVSRVEDFESDSYEPLTIEDFGGWTMIDADRLKTYTFMSDTRNPYRTERMAYQLYDPVAAGVPQDYMVDVPCHSGSRFLAAWSAQGVNDNWLISPALSGSAQTISFYARSFTSYIPESFEILYSTSGKDTESFVKLNAVDNVPEVWTEYTYALPEGARYFAIRHTADDSYAFFLDDITFDGASELPADIALTGCRVYRDGKPAAETTGNATTITDTDLANGTHTYQVSALYNYGESRACEPVEITVGPSAINEIAANGVKVTVAGHQLIITGAAGESVVIAGIDGKVCYRAAAAPAEVKVTLPGGVYIVKAAKGTFKVAVGL